MNSRIVCIILGAALIWALFFKDMKPVETKVETKTVLVPAIPLHDRPSQIIVGDANGGQDRVVWERQR